ncbi:MAG: aspartate--tRNA ligase [Prevotella sp.]|nr:aspartate--tRNA ligase [Prevotella sp.]
MYRTNTCGELRLQDAGKKVTLAGWVQRTRKMGGMTFVDVRDRYGITQIVFDESKDADLCARANKLGREFCVQIKGEVSERESKNSKIPTGDIEILASELNILSESITPPFTIEDNSDGGDDIRMKYRYLDLRRTPVRKNLELRHRMTILIRNFLDSKDFIEVETPILIGSTPEGARDFVVPSRMNPGQFYALPQSPQTLKQLLMVSGFDRYFQIAKCFRDEDLRADRQPEFTQIDCEMSFVDQDDVIDLFEDMARHLFKEVRGVELPAKLTQMSWHEAMRRFGSDKPDLRFGMEFVELMDTLKKGTFAVFDQAQYIGGICVPGCASYTRKQLDQLTDFVKSQQVGAKGLVYVKYNEDGTVKSSVDKFYTPEDWAALKEKMGAKDGDLVLILSGDNANKTRVQLCALRLEMAERLGLRDKNKFECLWIVDFPLFEWSDEEQRLMATHHPFTMPNPDDIPLLDEHPEMVRAKAYDFVCNGIEVGGGSLRIHDGKLQEKMFKILGFTPEKAMAQFGFLINAFKYGAPPHAGLAFGLDRFVSIMAGLDSIRDCIAFPKNNSGRDVMLDAPGFLDPKQLDELQLKLDLKEE